MTTAPPEIREERDTNREVFRLINWLRRQVISLSASPSLSPVTFVLTGDGNGEDGADGLPGQPGVTGAAGSPGAAGAQGLQGFPGIDGEDGADGRLGIDGRPGMDGMRGLPGIDGDPGEDGTPGLPGIVGAIGPMGLPGIPGITGEDGEDGRPGGEVISGMPMGTLPSEIGATGDVLRFVNFDSRIRGADGIYPYSRTVAGPYVIFDPAILTIEDNAILSVI